MIMKNEIEMAVNATSKKMALSSIKEIVENVYGSKVKYAKLTGVNRGANGVDQFIFLVTIK